MMVEPAQQAVGLPLIGAVGLFIIVMTIIVAIKFHLTLRAMRDTNDRLASIIEKLIDKRWRREE